MVAILKKKLTYGERYFFLYILDNELLYLSKKYNIKEVTRGKIAVLPRRIRMCLRRRVLKRSLKCFSGDCLT